MLNTWQKGASGTNANTYAGIAMRRLVLEIEDDGTVRIASSDGESTQKAIDFIKGITEDAEVGKIYNATVKRIMNFGAFCEILPGKEGLVHVSELSDTFVENVIKIYKEGHVSRVEA